MRLPLVLASLSLAPWLVGTAAGNVSWTSVPHTPAAPVFTTATTVTKGEWAKGIPYTTDWEDAIKQARESGRILLIYNGWQREGI